MSEQNQPQRHDAVIGGKNTPQPMQAPTRGAVLGGKRGWLSQETFTFETAKLQEVTEQQGKVWKAQKTIKQAERFVEELGDGVKLEMVYIPAGTFTMGAPISETDSSDDERPQHLIAVPEFYMGRYVVTQAQYLAVMGKNPSYWRSGQLPVENISWDDAQEFCDKLSAKTGKKYQLPSEAMWEYACRAGTTTPFYFGETINSKVANFYGDYTYGNMPKGKYREQTTVVGSFPANDFGIADMHGNVWEWCADHWHDNYQGAPLDGSLWSGDNDRRLMRGGSWLNYPKHCRSAYRLRWSAVNKTYNVGFRVIHLQDF